MAPALMCFGRKQQDPQKLRNEEIEKSLRLDKKRQDREIKLLLLGKRHKMHGIVIGKSNPSCS
jgi:guanine nucleotide-binding protein subunit alpha